MSGNTHQHAPPTHLKHLISLNKNNMVPGSTVQSKFQPSSLTRLPSQALLNAKAGVINGLNSLVGKILSSRVYQALLEPQFFPQLTE